MKTKSENGTIVARYYYNAQNKLVKIEGDGFVYEFFYDSQNRRIALSHNGTLKKIIHQGNIPIGELDSTNGITRWFVRGTGIAEGTGDVIAEIDKDDDPHFYLTNHRGDTVVVLNENASQETYLQYDAFGNVVTNTGSFLPTYTFSTKEFLSNAEVYLYQRRVYDPIAGRWTQRDPINYQDSVNLYNFCGNNPIIIVDEWGLKRVIITVGHLGVSLNPFSWARNIVLLYRADQAGKAFKKAGWDVEYFRGNDRSDVVAATDKEDTEAFLFYGHGSKKGNLHIKNGEYGKEEYYISELPKGQLNLVGIDACYSADSDNEKTARKSLKKGGTFVGYKGWHYPQVSEDEISKEIKKLLKPEK